MLCSLLLQAVTLLPAPAPSVAPVDAAYLEQLEAAAAASDLAAEQRAALVASTAAQQSALTAFARQGGQRARLASLLVSRAKDPASDALVRALIRVACTSAETNTAVACLLAPRWLPPGCAPALAYLAQDPSKRLSVRAAAISRLLEFGYHGAWPLARALLYGGTQRDLAPPPFADWQHGPRWELPKRLVVVGLDAWLLRNGGAASGFEPNAAWKIQVEQIEALEARVEAARMAQQAKPIPRAYAAERLDRAQFMALAELACAGDAIAEQALAWLLPQGQAWLREFGDQADAQQSEFAQRVFATLPD